MADTLQDLKSKLAGLNAHYDALKADYEANRAEMRSKAGDSDISALASQSVALMAEIQATEARMVTTKQEIQAEVARRDKPEYKKAVKMLADIQTEHTLMVVDIVKRVSELLNSIDDLDKSIAEHNRINSQYGLGVQRLALASRFSRFSNIYNLRAALQQWSKTEQRIDRAKERAKAGIL